MTSSGRKHLSRLPRIRPVWDTIALAAINIAVAQITLLNLPFKYLSTGRSYSFDLEQFSITGRDLNLIKTGAGLRRRIDAKPLGNRRRSIAKARCDFEAKSVSTALFVAKIVALNRRRNFVGRPTRENPSAYRIRQRWRKFLHARQLRRAIT